MVIACDTSFLFALYGNDVHSPKAVAWAAQSVRPVRLNSLTHYEFGNALRFAEFRKAIPAGTAAMYWSGFEAAVAHGRLIVVTSNLADVVDEARRLSSLRTLAGGHRGFDILHVASALKMRATHFLTFDANQKQLAEAEGLEVLPI
jgi:predicted nucleic acid-binding protein